MKELIHIEHKEGKDSVSAREIFEFLGFDKSQWARWAKLNIEEDNFFTKGVDWEGFDTMSNGNKTKDYALSLDMAKELSMLARNEKGKQARQYFIEVEKSAKKPLSHLDLFAQSLAVLQNQQKQLESQDQRITALEKNRIPIPANASEEYTIPTVLGKQFDPPKSGQAVNQLLVKAGFQRRVGSEWVPTREGEKWSKCHPMTLENGRVIYQVYWQRKVMEVVA